MPALKDLIFNNAEVSQHYKLFHFKNLKCGSAYMNLINARVKYSDSHTKTNPLTTLQSPGSFRNNSNGIFNFIFPMVNAAEDSSMDQLGLKEWRRQKMKETLSRETKQDRLRRMFTVDEFHSLSPELQYVGRCGFGALVVGTLYGVAKGATRARDDFSRRNNATAFESEYIARRKMTDTMTLHGVKAGFATGLKLALCTSIYMFVTTTVATYNNKVSIYEHIAAGTIMGVLWRLHFGLKGAAVAGALGGVLGIFGGASTLLLQKLSGITYEEFRYYQHELYGPEKQKSIEALESPTKD